MTPSDPSHFAAALRRHRLAAALSQEELAERAGLSTRGVSDLERGARRAPRPETVRRLAAALGLDDADRAALIAAVRPVADPAVAGPGTLPTPPTRLIGRDRELATLTGLLRPPAGGLVTVTGPGGIGKTRLALQAAAELGPAYADGAAFVPLASVADPAQVPRAIARILGVWDAGWAPVEDQIAAALAGREMLLVLDNFEQVLDAAPVVARLRSTNPRPGILATSRATLHVSGEIRFPTPPLAMPDPARPAAESAATMLFVDRARRARPDFDLTDENAADVAAICRRLDGLPLAIELAAARIAILPPKALLARLDRALAVLTGGPRDAPARLQTMRDAIAWSADLLDPGDRALFRRLAAFSDGWSLQAAAAVADGDENAALDALARLADHSLVRVSHEADAEPRFAMLSVIREYALERLEESGEAEALRERHAAHYRALAEEAARHIHAPDQATWLDGLDREHDNLRSALDWALRAEPETALRIAAALWLFWNKRGYWTEGRGWLDRALATDAPDDRARAEALLGVGSLAGLRGDFAAARNHFTASLDLWRRIGSDSGAARTQVSLGFAIFHVGDAATAAALIEETLPCFDGPEDAPWEGLALTNLGWAVAAMGDLDRALALGEAGLARQRAAGETWGAAVALVFLGDAQMALGNVAAAATRFHEALTAWTALGEPYMAAWALVGLAGLGAATGQPGRSARLAAAGQPLMERSGGMFPMFGLRYEAAMTALRDGLSPADLDAERARGRAMAFERALEEAAELVAEVHVSPPRAHVS